MTSSLTNLAAQNRMTKDIIGELDDFNSFISRLAHFVDFTRNSKVGFLNVAGLNLLAHISKNALGISSAWDIISFSGGCSRLQM